MVTKKGKQWFFIGKKARRHASRIDMVIIIFWNVAESTRKDKDYWEYIQDYDYAALLKTWIDVISWDKIKLIIPNNNILQDIGSN